MNKLYVFAIGGSGARVLRSLTMLLASGVQTNYEIVPMILDPDYSNGDLCRCVNLVRLYQTIHNKLSFTNDIKNKFFRNPLSALNNNHNFLMPLIGTSGISFEDYISLSEMSYPNQGLMRMLFSNTNLASDMNVGFKGNPNIGSVVLNQFTDSKDFECFSANFVNGDKVFIISSIFGGTGASGFPLLLKTMRTNPNAALADAPIGAVSLLPYFNLQPNKDSSIQADSFITKAKAALNYYEKNVTGNNTLDHIYYVGDDFTSVGYDNCDGGDNQVNNAHLVELIAAMSIFDYANKDIQPDSTRQTQFHEFGLKGEAQQDVSFGDFGPGTNALIRRPLTMLSLLKTYLEQRDENHRSSQKWAKDYKNLLGESFWLSDDFRNINTFLTLYKEWISEMENNHISFHPFKLVQNIDDALDIVVGFAPQYGKFKIFGKKGCDLIDEKLSSNIGSLPKNLEALQAFMELFFITLNDLSKDKLKF